MDISDNSGLPAQPGSARAPSPPRRVRVAWILEGRTLDRLGRVLQPLAIGLMDELVEIVAFCPRQAETKELPSPPVEIIRHGRLRWMGFDTGARRSLADEIRSRKIQLLHALCADGFPLTRALAGMSGVPFVVGSYTRGDGRKLAALSGGASAALAASEPILRDLLERRVAPAENIHLMRPGVYQVRKATCFSGRNQSVAVVTGCDLDDYSAFAGVLRSFAELRSRGYDCQFFVIGNGRAESRLRALAEKLGLLGELSFVDHQSGRQLAGILKAADVYVSPSPSKWMDIPSLLAMAAGNPVLVAEGSSEDYFQPGKTVLEFSPGETGELTAALAGLLDDPEAGRRLAGSALEYLREKHSPARMVSKLASLYRRVTEPPPSRNA